MKVSRDPFLIAVAAIAMIGAGCAKKKVALKPQPTPASTPVPAQSTPVRAATAPARQTPTANTTANAVKPQQYPSAATRARIDQLLGKIEDAYFDFDQHTLRPDAIEALKSDSTELRDILKDYPNYKLTIEGNADERGSTEYNMALGDARAHSAKDYLVQVGIPADQLGVVSNGKEKPVCQQHDESCWQKNRRIHIVAMAR